MTGQRSTATQAQAIARTIAQGLGLLLIVAGLGLAAAWVALTLGDWGDQWRPAAASNVACTLAAAAALGPVWLVRHRSAAYLAPAALSSVLVRMVGTAALVALAVVALKLNVRATLLWVVGWYGLLLTGEIWVLAGGIGRQVNAAARNDGGTDDP